jgi:hypothetical protein
MYNLQYLQMAINCNSFETDWTKCKINSTNSATNNVSICCIFMYQRYISAYNTRKWPKDKHSQLRSEDKHSVLKSEDKRRIPKSEDKHSVLKSEDKRRVPKSEDKHREPKSEDKRRVLKLEDLTQSTQVRRQEPSK